MLRQIDREDASGTGHVANCQDTAVQFDAAAADVEA
jgi:hypothetical protein